MELAPGIMVTPTVRLVRLLGQGGMGSVWVADHLTLKTEVAVRFLLADLVRSNPGMLARFEREASAAARIKSPHVVATFDYGVVEDGTPYIVMELLDGESLSERVARAGPLSVGETGQVLAQVAKALRKAHQLGIVHRDIKPDNLFLVDSGTLGPALIRCCLSKVALGTAESGEAARGVTDVVLSITGDLTVCGELNAKGDSKLGWGGAP